MYVLHTDWRILTVKHNLKKLIKILSKLSKLTFRYRNSTMPIKEWYNYSYRGGECDDKVGQDTAVAEQQTEN